jgi:hypothetical protein
MSLARNSDSAAQKPCADSGFTAWMNIDSIRHPSSRLARGGIAPFTH